MLVFAIAFGAAFGAAVTGAIEATLGRACGSGGSTTAALACSGEGVMLPVISVG